MAPPRVNDATDAADDITCVRLLAFLSLTRPLGRIRDSASGDGNAKARGADAPKARLDRRKSAEERAIIFRVPVMIELPILLGLDRLRLSLVALRTASGSFRFVLAAAENC